MHIFGPHRLPRSSLLLTPSLIFLQNQTNQQKTAAQQQITKASLSTKHSRNLQTLTLIPVSKVAMDVLSFSSPVNSPSIFSRRLSPFRLGLRGRFVACSAETLVAASGEKSVEAGGLKSWLHKEGLPPCKVVLKERPSHDGKHRPIHYVAASEDLKVNWIIFLNLYGICSSRFGGEDERGFLVAGWGCGVLSAEFFGCHAGESFREWNSWYENDFFGLISWFNVVGTCHWLIILKCH